MESILVIKLYFLILNSMEIKNYYILKARKFKFAYFIFNYYFIVELTVRHSMILFDFQV